MRASASRRLCVAALLLLTGITGIMSGHVGASSAASVARHASPAIMAKRHSTNAHVYGIISDAHPATDAWLLVYSKTHHTTYRVRMTRVTIVKNHTLIVPRAALRSGMRVIVTCQQGANGTLTALTVHIEKATHRSTKHAKTHKTNKHKSTKKK